MTPLSLPLQFALEMCLAARNRQKKSTKTPIFAFKVIQVIEFRANREPVLYNFLLVIIVGLT